MIILKEAQIHSLSLNKFTSQMKKKIDLLKLQGYSI